MHTKLKIGPVIIALEASHDPMDGTKERFEQFRYFASERPHLVVRIHSEGGLPSRKNEERPVGLKNEWQLYRERDSFRLEFLDGIKFQTKSVVSFASHWREADFYWSPPPHLFPQEFSTRGWCLEEVLGSAVMWWLTLNPLADFTGFLVHGAAVSWRDYGYVFVGPSGAGKSTLVRLLSDSDPEVLVLNDERVLIWQERSEWRVTGTPWPGRFERTTPSACPIKGVFILKKGSVNRSIPLSPLSHFELFFPEVFSPLWNPDRLTHSVDRVTKFLEEVEGAELHFVNNPTVYEYLRQTLAPLRERTLVPKLS